MKKLLLSAFVLIALSCSKDEGNNGNNAQSAPGVSLEPAFGVSVDLGVQYAEGLTHDSLNDPNSTSMPLLLDVYKPINTSANRPALVFIHGGGFQSGSRQSAIIVQLANYFASRGWVFVSISYRLEGDIGTVPDAWANYTRFMPADVRDQVNAVYPAQRDAKAALRWLAANASAYGINKNHISVAGSSAGAISALAVGATEPQDYRDEIDLATDPTLSTTNLNQNYKVRTVLDFWGSQLSLDLLEQIYGHQRFDSNDPSVFIAHGTLDSTVSFTSALQLMNSCEQNNIPYVLHELDGYGHGAWGATVEGKNLDQLAFEFIVQEQGLVTF